MGGSDSRASSRDSKLFPKHVRNQSAFNLSVEELVDRLVLQPRKANNSNGCPGNLIKDIEIGGKTYNLIEFVNKGGFGEIYKAKAQHNKKLVAVKIMDNSPGIQDEIKNEISFLRVMKDISLENHPIIEYYGCDFKSDRILIAMELASCDLLTFWFAQVARVDPDEKLLLGIIIIIYVLRALTFLEKLNIIHGDIKPQNIVVVEGDRSFYLKLIDFGTVEKMDTKRAQVTVDADKAHTVFFASPEFLRRDSRNLVCRHLHKKSDAWAAGVMFYVLFFERFPWRDQFEYENFCNDSRVRDVFVPEDVDFKIIIELLLKKNPEQRASAKETLKQIKWHPLTHDITKSLERTFCRISDVCEMNIPANVRTELSKLARPGHFVDNSRQSFNRQFSGRRSCRYGQKCYRKDVDHRDEFAHPGDADYYESDDSLSRDSNHKIPCRYGSVCYNKDLNHQQKYAHPNDSKHRSHSAIRQNHSNMIPCRYGNKCYDTTREHRTKFFHMPNSSHNHQPVKEKCRYWNNCTNSEKEHRLKYVHPGDSNPHQNVVNRCNFGHSCTNFDPVHPRDFHHSNNH